MSKHTPGPWSDEQVWDTPETKVHAFCCGKEYALAEVYSMPAPGEREANAKLIAAAPDLLAACLTTLEKVELCDCGHADCASTQLRAAIAKATA